MPFAGSGGGGGVVAAGEEEAEEDVSTVLSLSLFCLSVSLRLSFSVSSRLWNESGMMLTVVLYRTHNIYAPSGDAASTADTTMSGTLVPGPLAPTTTPLPVIIPASKPKSVPSPEEENRTTTMTGKTHPQAAAPASSETAQAAATLERITALENQVSSLEAKVLDLLVRLDEVSSCAGADSTTPRRQENNQQEQQERAAAGAALSAAVTSDVTACEDLQNLSNPAAAATASPPAAAQPALVNAAGAPSERVEGAKAQDTSLSSSLSSSPVDITAAVQDAEISSRPEQHSIEHPEGYRPVNCSCTTGTGPRVEG